MRFAVLVSSPSLLVFLACMTLDLDYVFFKMKLMAFQVSPNALCRVFPRQFRAAGASEGFAPPGRGITRYSARSFFSLQHLSVFLFSVCLTSSGWAPRPLPYRLVAISLFSLEVQTAFRVSEEGCPAFFLWKAEPFPDIGSFLTEPRTLPLPSPGLVSPFLT